MSNDPLGELEKDITYSVNRDATIRLADLVKKAVLKKFIYYSTQSIYGISKVSEELDEYESIKKSNYCLCDKQMGCRTAYNKFGRELSC